MSPTSPEAKGLLKNLTRLETGIYIAFWNDLLKRVNIVSKKLQSCDIDLNTSIALLKSLEHFFKSLREMFDHYETLGKKISGCEDYEQSHKRIPS